MYVVERGLPLNWTTVVGTNPLPEIVTVVLAEYSGTTKVLRLVIAGVGLATQGLLRE